MIKFRKVFVIQILIITLCFEPMIVSARSKETRDIETQMQDTKHDLTCSLNGQTYILDYNVNPYGKYIYPTPVYNEFGDRVSGVYHFSVTTDDLVYGYNNIQYTFEPIYYMVYNNASGLFTIINKIKPKIIAKKKQIQISLDEEYYKFNIDGKESNTNTFKNLKPSTTYKIKVYQKANDFLAEDTLIDTFTVKTKKK